MKVLIDSNILISALFYPNSNPSKALLHAAKNHELCLTKDNISDIKDIEAASMSSTAFWDNPDDEVWN